MGQNWLRMKRHKAKTKSPKAVAKTLTNGKLQAKGVKHVQRIAANSKADKSPPLVSRVVAHKMLASLCDLYPDASCELVYDTPFQLLIATILSAQTTDVAVNKASKDLFQKFGTAKALAEADLDEVKKLIKPTGYYNTKATNIQKCAQALLAHFKGQVPKTQAELTTLPGVGVKTANVVLGEAYGIPGWTVDTHVQRLSHRLGLTSQTDPLKIEHDLQKIFHKADWTKLSITLIWHGRRMCFARKPNCQLCPINDLCPSSAAD
jgi:endonuclease-3